MISAAPATDRPLEIPIWPPLESHSWLPEVLPIVKADGEAILPKVMPPIFNGLALVAVASTLITRAVLVRKVATSVLVNVLGAPGKVPSPVLQLSSPVVASQMPFVGTVFHVALAALAE